MSSSKLYKVNQYTQKSDEWSTLSWQNTTWTLLLSLQSSRVTLKSISTSLTINVKQRDTIQMTASSQSATSLSMWLQ